MNFAKNLSDEDKCLRRKGEPSCGCSSAGFIDAALGTACHQPELC